MQFKSEIFTPCQLLPSDLIREYAEALSLYKEKTNQVRDLRKFIDRLNNIMSDRQNRYKIMRR